MFCIYCYDEVFILGETRKAKFYRVVNSQHNLFHLSVIYSLNFRGSLRKERRVQEQEITRLRLTNLDWCSGFFKLVRLKIYFFFLNCSLGLTHLKNNP